MAYATRRSYAGAAPACTLTNTITSGDTTISLTGDVTNWTTTANGPFFAVIDAGLATEEKILVGTRSVGVLSSVTRGVDGTVAAAHTAGATCYPVFTAVDADQANKVASTLTTKGDILATDGSALNRLAVGTNAYALLADSTATNGVAWGQVAAAGLATDAVTTVKILDANVTAAKLASDSVTQAKIADRAVGSAELTNLTVATAITDTYTLVLADAQKIIPLNKATAFTVTVPPNSSVAFTIGDQVNLLQTGAGQITVAGGSGVTVNPTAKLKLNGQYAAGTLVKVDTNSWVLIGNTVA